MNKKIEVILTNSKKDHFAKGIYEKGKLTVKKGSIIRAKRNSEYKRAKAVVKYRNDKKYLDNELVLKQDIEFSSPSTAAQFVRDTISNGYRTWKVDNKTSLKKYILEIKLEEIPSVEENRNNI